MQGLPNPHPSQSPLPFSAVKDVRLDLWQYRLHRSLQVNWTKGQLTHNPYYRPYSALDAGFTAPPFLFGAAHLFEWHNKSEGYPLLQVYISIDPAFAFPDPVVVYSNSPHYACPCITLLWWDCPLVTPTDTFQWILDYDESLAGADLDLFAQTLDDFFVQHYLPISPYNSHPARPLRPPYPPLLPFTPSNTHTIPLVALK
jgi:hypothetical protein